jgi:WD40 repeat protein
MPETCCQTLVGHGASVTAILDSRKGYVVSSSNDGSVKVWRPQDVHAPHSSSKAVFFLCSQSIHLTSHDPSFALRCMAVSFPVSSRNGWELFVGDSIGDITYFQEKARAEPLVFVKRWEHVHSLMISDLMYVQEHAFLVSISFDCTVS